MVRWASSSVDGRMAARIAGIGTFPKASCGSHDMEAEEKKAAGEVEAQVGDG